MLWSFFGLTASCRIILLLILVRTIATSIASIDLNVIKLVLNRIDLILLYRLNLLLVLHMNICIRCFNADDVLSILLLIRADPVYFISHLLEGAPI